MIKRTFELHEKGVLQVEPSYYNVPLQPDEDALGLSIQKWQAIVACLSNGRTVRDEGGAATCALCQAYTETRCEGCPVEAATGFKGCDHTPYRVWVSDPVYFELHHWLCVARQEVKFLQSLRGEEHD